MSEQPLLPGSHSAAESGIKLQTVLEGTDNPAVAVADMLFGPLKTFDGIKKIVVDDAFGFTRTNFIAAAFARAAVMFE